MSIRPLSASTQSHAQTQARAGTPMPAKVGVIQRWRSRLFNQNFWRCLMFCLGVWCAPAHAVKGLNVNELYHMTPAEVAARVDAYRSLGLKWVRFDFDWSVMQPTPTTYNTAGYDVAVKALTAAGINVLGVIAYTPPWANGGQESKFYPPTNAKTFARFAAYLAGRYAPLGVHTWEIWNEPNLAQFWGPAPDPRAYAALLRATTPQIRHRDPRAFVVTGGLAQPGDSATSMDARLFLQVMYGSGAKNYFDAVGNHPYTSPQMPLDEGVNNWKKMYAISISFLSIMSQYNDSNKRIWITEYGGPTSGVDSYGTVMTEQQQATMVNQSLQIVGEQPWAGPVFWYNFQDFCATDPNRSSECFFGLVRSDGSPKPAFFSFKNAPQ